MDSYAAGGDLEVGARGYLTFAGSAPAVTERPLQRSERLRRHLEQRSRSPSQVRAPARRRSSAFWAVVLAGLLLVVILLVLY